MQLKTGMDFISTGLKTGMENGVVWYKTGSEFGEPDGTPLTKIPTSTSPPPGEEGGRGLILYLK